MELVIDAGILFTALTGRGVTKNIIFSSDIRLFAPEQMFNELDKHRLRARELSKLSSVVFDKLLEKLLAGIEKVPAIKFGAYIKQAGSLISDEKDVPYLALSFSLDKIPIWSNDAHFQESSVKSVVTVFKTEELVNELKSKGFLFPDA